MTDDSATSTADRILMLVKTRGPLATAELAEELELTPEAARQQVQKLAQGGLLEGQQAPISGAGRPRQRWALTEAGHRRFPDAHAQLTVQLIASVRQLFGEEGMDRLIGQRECETRVLYRQACQADSVVGRLQQLAEVRTREGYMARVEADGADWLLIEDHCPICAAATVCQGFCRSELQLFREVIGADAEVEREQHLLSDANRCVYRVRLK